MMDLTLVSHPFLLSLGDNRPVLCCLRLASFVLFVGFPIGPWLISIHFQVKLFHLKVFVLHRFKSCFLYLLDRQVYFHHHIHLSFQFIFFYRVFLFHITLLQFQLFLPFIVFFWFQLALYRSIVHDSFCISILN